MENIIVFAKILLFVLCVPFLFVLIRYFFAPNSVSYDVESLDGRAKITSITSKVEGRKNGKHVVFT